LHEAWYRRALHAVHDPNAHVRALAVSPP
jgi:hypothetical protein